MRRTLTACVAVSVCALAPAACGGSTPSKQDMIARGNAICDSALRAVRAAAAPTAQTGSLPALAQYLRRILPVIDREASEITALPRPAQDRELLSRYIAALTAADAEYRVLADAAQRGDAGATAQALATLRANPADTLARRYGLAGCGTPSSTGVS
jgi:hypothetical protein